MVKEVHVTVLPSYAGRTIAAILKQEAGVSHAAARGVVEAGLASVDGRPCADPARRLSAGQDLKARFDPDALPRRSIKHDKAGGFRVILRDDAVLAVEKDAGILTVPAAGRVEGSLTQRLLHGESRRGVRDPRLWVVHRIDRFTSGLVLFGRTERAAQELIEQFRLRAAVREYLALCDGVPREAEGRLVSRLVENPRTLKMRIARPGEKKAVEASCSYVVEERLRGAALLRVRLETGRRNQIRVQLAAIGHPVTGDRSYGTPSEIIGRPALHAARLGFSHPVTGRPIRLESPLPGDMKRALRRLRRPGAP